jgi:hypothetical protein
LVIELEDAFATAGGPPKALRMDNGPELVSQALQRFCENKVGRRHASTAEGAQPSAVAAATKVLPDVPRPFGVVRATQAG